MDLKKEILNANSICINGHMHPDGDCVGSALSIYNYILKICPEKKVKIYLQKSNEKFSLLAGYDKIENIPNDDINYDLAIAVDLNNVDRLAEFKKYYENAKRKIVIDHHENCQLECDDSYIYPEISSTAELCFELFDKNYIDKNIAECIYLGIIHDTGVFRYNSTTSRTLEIASFLMQKGIDFNKIQEETLFSKSYIQQKTIGFCLSRLKLFLNGKIAFSYITLKEQNDLHAKSVDLDNVIFYIKENDTASIAIFAYEISNGLFKISFRSKDSNVDLSKIALKYNGGGHKMAAGAQMKLHPDKIIEILQEEFR